jgi:hypothetical protein
MTVLMVFACIIHISVFFFLLCEFCFKRTDGNSVLNFWYWNLNGIIKFKLINYAIKPDRSSQSRELARLGVLRETFHTVPVLLTLHFCLCLPFFIFGGMR